MSILCIEELSLEVVCLSKNKHAKIYKLGSVSMSNTLKLSLQELLGPSLSIILIITFCIKNTLHMVVDETQKIVPYISN